jgi:hypothetical protein
VSNSTTLISKSAYTIASFSAVLVIFISVPIVVMNPNGTVSIRGPWQGKIASRTTMGVALRLKIHRNVKFSASITHEKL